MQDGRPHWHLSMHADGLLMLGSVAMESNAHHTAQHQYWRFSMSVCEE